MIEILVAVAVLAVLVGLVPRSFVFARSILDHSRDWMNARLVAESVLNDTLVGVAIRPGARSGQVDGRRWRVTMRPNSEVAPGEEGQTLLDVRLEVDVSAGRKLVVETMRVGAAQ